MGVTVDVRQVYRYPFEQVVASYLRKYPSPMEKHVKAIKTMEEKNRFVHRDYLQKENCNMSECNSRNLKKVKPFQTNCCPLMEADYWKTFETTDFIQKGKISVTGAGLLNCVLEAFAQTFLNQGVKKGIRIMETLLQEQCGCPFS